ncbi:PDDEXK nuclease domain-containing protein [Patescibacteria group bacterium AH-259-L05]|nr:PDDEXK nuclease domain-containing protein [Patescibacteria group bacterium AH-259-L05]
MAQKLTKNRYSKLIENISELVNEARKELVKTVNTKIVNTYWNVGKYIVEYEQKGRERADYGSRIMKTLSKDLSTKLGRGFSQRNLRDMRRFYIGYPKWQTVSAKLSWSHYCLLLSIEGEIKRRFYENESIKNLYSFRELKRQISAALYERLALSKDKKGLLELAKKGQIIEKPKDVVKDPYILEFLRIPESEKLSETKLESALIRHLRDFLLELGRGFSFVDRQYRITMNNRHNYVDLVFYHIELKCYVLIDLKVRELRHEDAGQMNFYLNYFKNEVKIEDDNPPIGIILCLEKDRVYVDYVLGGLSNKIFASKYKLKLPTPKELAEEIKKDIPIGDKK